MFRAQKTSQPTCESRASPPKPSNDWVFLAFWAATDMLQEQHRGVWWHFQFGWTRTNQEVSQGNRVFSCFSRLTGMAPAQANDTHLWMAQERGSRCCFRFFTRLGFALLNAKLAVPGHRESDGKLFDSSLWVPLKPLSMTPQCPPLHAESAQKNENSDNNSR